MARTKILCVDDHAFLVEGLKTRIEAEFDLEFVGWCESADGVVGEVRRLEPDIVLMDIEMPGADAFEAVRDLKRMTPDVRVIMLSAFVRDRYIDLAYEAGAWGYMSKNDPPDSVIAGIRRVLNGQLATSDAVKERAQPRADTRGVRKREDMRSRLDSITKREMEVLRMIAHGMSRTDIAEQLHRSPMTIDNHRKSIMKKLGINDRGELVRYAIAEGLVEP